MKLGNKSVKVFTSPDEISAYNWYKVMDGKLIYLLDLKDYNKELFVRGNLLNRIFVKLFKKVPENALFISKDKLKTIEKAQELIIYDLDIVNSEILEAKKEIVIELLELVIDVFENSRDFDKIIIAGTVLDALMITDNPDINWLYEFDFTETREQKRQLTEIARAISFYNYIKKTNNKSDTLNEKAVKMEIVLGFKINTKKTSLAKFIEYERATLEKLKQQSNGNRQDIT